MNYLEGVIDIAQKIKSTDTHMTIGKKEINLESSHLAKRTKDFIGKHLLPLEALIEKWTGQDNGLNEKQIQELELLKIRHKEWEAFVDEVIQLVHVQGYMLASLSESVTELTEFAVFDSDGHIPKNIKEFQREPLNKLWKHIKVLESYHKNKATKK